MLLFLITLSCLSSLLLRFFLLSVWCTSSHSSDSLPGGATGEAYAKFKQDFHDFFVPRCYAGPDFKPPPHEPVSPPPPRSFKDNTYAEANALEDEGKTNGGAVDAPRVDALVSEIAAKQDPVFAAEQKEYYVERAAAAWKAAEEAGVVGAAVAPAEGLEGKTVVATAEGKAFAARTGHSVVSLVIQHHLGMSNASDETAQLDSVFGHPYIHDVVQGLVFRVNVNSFFQVNTLGAEALYGKVAEWALAPPHDFSMPASELLQRYGRLPAWFHPSWRFQAVNPVWQDAGDAEEVDGEEDSGSKSTTSASTTTSSSSTSSARPSVPPAISSFEAKKDEIALLSPIESDAERSALTTVLDVCCGTGTIGLTMANKVKKVVGLELVAAAIEDAKYNMNLNKIENAEFVCGRAENTIKAALVKEGAVGDNKDAMVVCPFSLLMNYCGCCPSAI